MVDLLSLWLPILVSAVFVFIASSAIHMLLRYHRNDLKGIPSEDGVMADLQKYDIPPGDYMLPHGDGPDACKDEAFIAKCNKGPVAIMTVIGKGVPSMGKSMVGWFLYIVLVSLFAGYVARIGVGLDGNYIMVFRIVGTVAFAGYSLALLQGSIWWHRNWCVTIKGMFDGLIYALLTAGTFGWLWPR